MTQKQDRGVSRGWPPTPRNRGVSTGYSVLYGLMGIGLVGLVYAILDQVILTDIYDFALDNQLSGTMLNLFMDGWVAIPVIIVATYVVGGAVTAHQERSDKR